MFGRSNDAGAVGDERGERRRSPTTLTSQPDALAQQRRRRGRRGRRWRTGTGACVRRAGSVTIGAGSQPRERARAARARRPRRRRSSADDRRARSPQTIACVGARSRAPRRAPSSIAGQQRARGGLEVVDVRVARVDAVERRRAASAEPVGLARRRRRSRAASSARQDEDAVGARRAAASVVERARPPPVASTRRGRDLARARRSRAARRASCSSASSPRPLRALGEPQRGGGVGRAARHARPRPGCACRSSIRTGGPSQPVARAERGAARRAARFGPSTPGQTTSSRVVAGLERDACRRAASGSITRDELVPAVVADRSDVQAEVDLRRARARSRAAPPRARGTARATGARRARRRAGRAARAPRGPSSRSATPASCSERASALRRCANAPCTSARSARSAAPAPVRVEADEHAVDVRHRVEDACARRAQDLHVAGELGEHRRHAVRAACPARAAKRSPTSFCTIATQRVRRRQLLERLEDRGRGDAVGQVRDDLRRRAGRAPARSSSSASARCSVVFGCGSSASRSAGSSERSSSTTWTCARALGEVLGQHAEAAADLQHDVVGAEVAPRAR